ncbi:MAG: glycosyltransferase [Algoriphagus sp.]|nr:glycosyltransferase [Algoriphagus sp.]
MRTIVHLSHTDIRTDSRILKELKALYELDNNLLIGIGLERSESNVSINQFDYCQIITLKMRTRSFSVFPRFIRLLLFTWLWTAIEMHIKMIVTSLKYKPRVLHCHDVYVLPAGFILKLITGCSLVYDAHELESEKNGTKRIESVIIKLIEGFSWKSIDLFITVSDSIHDWYIKKYGINNGIVILNSPVISACNAIESNYLRRKYEIPIEKKIFIYVGMLMPGRGIDLYLDVFQDERVDSHIVFLGYGIYDLEIREMSLSNEKIHLHEPVEHSEVVGIISTADFGLCMIENISLSDYYCLPNKLFEYIFAGLPVIASRNPEIENLVIKYKLGVCCDNSKEDLIRCINNVSTIKVSVNNLELYELGWHAQTSKLVESYKNLIR